MKKRTVIIFIILFALLPSFLCMGAGQAEQLIQNLKKDSELNSKNRKSEFINHDLTELFKPTGKFLGFIGKNYRWLKVYYTKVAKKSSDTYEVTGYTSVGGNHVDFKGNYTIREILLFNNVDPEYKNEMKKEGVIIADYKFNENKKQKQSGVFSGRMYLYWYMDTSGKLHYNYKEGAMHSYKNNQHAGTWQGYGKTSLSTCNWGISRIPFSGDLDLGDGEFGPDTSKYPSWKNFEKEFYGK